MRSIPPLLGAVFVFGLGGSAGAESSTFVVSDPAVAVQSGQHFAVRLLVHRSEPGEPLDFMKLYVQYDPGTIELLAWYPGKGLTSHATVNGEPLACDVENYTDGGQFAMHMELAAPFWSNLYGPEWILLEYRATAAAPRETEVFFQFETYAALEETNLPVVIAVRPILRGDVDADLACDLTDAITILNHVRGESRIDCMDAADLDDDGRVVLTDAILLLHGLFLGTFRLDTECRIDLVKDQLTDCDLPGC